MSFVFPIILGGLITASVPILLHLIMRQKPKILPFPAFRFLVQRSKTNLRKLRLRHLLLLVLRVLLLAAICLALARPKLVTSALNLSSDRPVAAIFVFDTSYSMTYQNSDKLTRLDDARKRGLELLDELPAGSKVAVLDTAETAASREWLESPAEARERIKTLKPRYANAPLTARLQDAYRMFAEFARAEEDPSKVLPRFLCVFSDRTRASWDQTQMNDVFEKSDEVPSTVAGLQKLRDDVPALLDALKDLRQRIPPAAGQDYPEQALIDGLGVLRNRVSGLTSEDLPTDRELKKQLAAVRKPARQLLATLQKQGEPAAEKEYRDKLIASLHAALSSMRGVHAVFIDVGVDSPADLAIIDLEFPRSNHGQPQQLFPQDKEFTIRGTVQATGKDYNQDLVFSIGGKEFQRQPIPIKAGEKQPFEVKVNPLELKLPNGANQLEVWIAASGGTALARDLLPFNNRRYATFAIREPRRILVVADEPARAAVFERALQSNKFTVNVMATKDFLKDTTLPEAQAVYLFDVAQPSDELWGALEKFVKHGGGLGLIPGGDEVKPKAYNTAAAQKLMPGELQQRVKFGDLSKEENDKNRPAMWDLDEEGIFQHPIMRPFREWKAANWDLIRSPRRAAIIWDVKPVPKGGVPIVHYAEPKKHAALWERQFDKEKSRMGRVLLFTTTFDEKREPAWNDYLTAPTFYVVIAALATQYLTGDTEEPKLNFLSGRPPLVRLPVSRKSIISYTLHGPGDSISVNAAEEQNDLLLKQVVTPGNYALEALKGNDAPGQRLAAFSVNMPAEESDLTRVPPAEIESLFGTAAIVGIERRLPIREALAEQGHWNEPIELFPFLMVLLLLVLALENLLANKFYKREEEPT
jgi:hypothetical protein